MCRSSIPISRLALLSLVVFSLSLACFDPNARAQKSQGPRRPLPKPASGPRGFEQSTGRDASSRLIAAGATRGPLAPVAPLEGLAYDARPLFVWEAAPGARSYHFTLREGTDSSSPVIYETDTTDSSLSYPTGAPALVPGKLYMWRVSTAGVLEKKSGAPATFFVLEGEDASQVKTALEKEKLLDPQSAAERLKQARVFEHYGVWYDALRVVSRVMTDDPKNAEAKAYYDHLVATLTSEKSASNDKQSTLMLEPGRAVEREIAGRERQSYRVKVEAGQFLHVIVEQRGIDVTVALVGLDGKPLVEVDTPDLSTGLERVSLVAQASGVYEMVVRPFKEDATAGRYEIRVAELRAAQPEDNDRVAAEKLFAEGEALRLQWTAASLRSSLEKYEASLKLWRALKDLYGEGTTLNIISLVYAQMGERQKSLDYLKLAIPARHTAGDVPGEIQSLNNIAVAYDSFGQREKALEYYNQALELQYQVGDRSLEVFLLNNIGSIYLEMGQIQKALDHFNRALPMVRATGDRRGEAFTQSTIGGAYSSLGEDEKALEHYQEALRLWRSVGIRREEAGTLNALAYIHLSKGQYEKAVEYLKQAIALMDLIADKSVKADTLSALAWIYTDESDYKKALEAYNVALAVTRDLRDRSREGNTLASFGVVYYRTGEFQKAVSHFNQSLAIMREIKNRSGEGNILSWMMYTWKALGKPRLAIFYGKQAINAFQELRTNIQGLEKNLQKSFLKTREDPYRELSNLLVSEGRLTEAQAVLGLLKEEEYFEFVRRSSDEATSLNGRAALTSAEAEMARKYLEIAERVTAYGRERVELLGKQSLTPEEEQRLKKLESDLELASQAFQRFLDQLAEEFAGSRQGSEKVFQLREAQGLMQDLKELGAGSVALYTIVGEDKYRVILTTAGTQVAREYSIKATDLFNKVLAFREALQDPTQDPKPLAAELYKILVGPIAHDLAEARAETLMWSLDGVLRYVPVAALHDGERYMVERYRNVVYTPASQARLKEIPARTWKGLGLGVSKAQTGFKPLPAVPGELRGIIREEAAAADEARAEGVLPGSVMLDEAFTEDAMKRALRQKYSLVHIASHFQILPGNETSSFLLLGDGTHLTLAQIKSAVNLFGGVEMLTLSACDTATGGTTESGKEVEGFAVLAQRQGAKAVIATLWAVADESTRLLMQKFYRLREAGEGTLKAEALRQAQLALLRGDGKQPGARTAPYAHPYFWAPFILIGNWK